MKKFTMFMLTAMIGLFAYAQQPVVHLGATQNMKRLLTTVQSNPRNDFSTTATSFRAPKKAASDYVIITEQPEGELKSYVRSGGHYVTQDQNIYYGDQNGVIDIVWGKDNKVYFKDIISGLAYGTWVEGTLSEDSTSISVPLGQNIYYSSNYDACIAIRLIVYNQGFSVDTVSTEAVFTVEDDVLSLQGTGFGTVSLGAVWTDDGTFQNYGDYESVYTPYEASTDLVELPEGVEVVEKPMEGHYFASFADYNAGKVVELNTTVKVGRADTTIYFQGIFQDYPEAWIKGELSEGEIEIPVTYLADRVYAMGYSQSGVAPIYMIYNEDLDAYELDGYIMLSDNELSNTMDGIYEGVYIGERPALVEVPENLQTVEMSFKGTNSDNKSVTGTVNVGIDGSDVYIQGLVSELPDSWMKGSFTEDGSQLIIPSGQYMGVHPDYGMSVYLVSSNEDDEICDITFDYDAENNAYVLTDTLYVNAKDDVVYYYYYLKPGLIIGEVKETATATFNFNALGTEEEPWPVGSGAEGDPNYHNGDITESLTLTADAITLEIAPAFDPDETDDKDPTPTRFWGTTNGPQLRCYSNTLTFTAPTGCTITSITFNYNGKYWGGNNNGGKVTADPEGNGIADEKTLRAATWTGSAQTVVFTFTANTQINSINVTYEMDPSYDPSEAIDADYLVYDFEDGTLQGWTNIDADGDGNVWAIAEKGSTATHDNSGYSVFSMSYDNNSGALTPDNYFVSPKLKLGEPMKFYACAQDASYPAEHFGVFVSTEGKLADKFQKVEEWNMTASRATQPMKAKGMFRSPKKAPGNWYEYTVDLSAFEGEEGYVAIRHFNCTDNFYLVVDDISFGTPAFEIDPAEGVVESLSDFTIIFNKYEITADDVAAATLTNTTTNNSWDAPVVAKGDTLTVDFDEDITEPGEYTLTIEGVKKANGEPVEGLTFEYTILEIWTLCAVNQDGDVHSPVEIEIDGENMYLKGLGLKYVPDAWVEGVIDGQTVTFASGQYLGEYYNSELYLCGYDGENLKDITFTYDEENGRLSTDDYILLNTSADEVDPDAAYYYAIDILKDFDFEPVAPVVPEGVEMVDYQLTAIHYVSKKGEETGEETEVEEEIAYQMTVGFDGNDVYFGGLSQDFSDAVAKGTLSEDGKTITIPANQFMGTYDVANLGWYLYDYYITSADTETGEMADLVFNYDAEAGKLTTDQLLILNGSHKLIYPYDVLYETVIELIPSVAAVPADPTFESYDFEKEVGYNTIYTSIPAQDVDGNDLLTSKLYYIVWIEKDGKEQPYTFTADLYGNDFEEDMTEIPYLYDGYDIYKGGEIIYLEEELEELATWTKVGIQSVYYGGGVRNTSNIVWSDGTVTTSALKGDVNNDGQVGIGDIVAITNVMAGIETDPEVIARADVNGDGQVGIGDIVAITNIMAGIE